MEKDLVDLHMQMKKMGNCSSVAKFKCLKYLVLVPGTLVHLRKFIFGKQMCYVDRVRQSNHFPMYLPYSCNRVQNGWDSCKVSVSHGHRV